MSMRQVGKRHSVRWSTNAACRRKVFVVIPLVLRSTALTPVQLAWLRAAAQFPAALARRRRRAYPSDVPEKEGNGFESPNYTGRRAAPCGNFFVCIASVRLQWAAVVGSLRAAGFRVYRSLNPTICRPPRLRAGRGVTTTHGGSHA